MAQVELRAIQFLSWDVCSHPVKVHRISWTVQSELLIGHTSIRPSHPLLAAPVILSDSKNERLRLGEQLLGEVLISGPRGPHVDRFHLVLVQKEVHKAWVDPVHAEAIKALDQGPAVGVLQGVGLGADLLREEGVGGESVHVVDTLLEAVAQQWGALPSFTAHKHGDSLQTHGRCYTGDALSYQ